MVTSDNEIPLILSESLKREGKYYISTESAGVVGENLVHLFSVNPAEAAHLDDIAFQEHLIAKSGAREEQSPYPFNSCEIHDSTYLAHGRKPAVLARPQHTESARANLPSQYN